MPGNELYDVETHNFEAHCKKRIRQKSTQPFKTATQSKKSCQNPAR
ncbi:hypothetical protein PSN_1737 [Pseudomonas sp. NGC7]